MAAAVEFIKQHKVASLFSASALVQLSLLLAGIYLLNAVSTPTETKALQTNTEIDVRASLAVENIEKAARAPLTKRAAKEKTPAFKTETITKKKPARPSASFVISPMHEPPCARAFKLTSAWLLFWFEDSMDRKF